MHPLIERFSRAESVRDVFLRGQRVECLDPLEQALWEVGRRETLAVQRLMEAFEPDEDGDVGSYLGDTAARYLATTAAVHWVLRDLRMSGSARAAEAACLASGVTEVTAHDAIADVLSEEAFLLPQAPGSFDRAWVEEAFATLAVSASTPLSKWRQLADSFFHRSDSGTQADRRAVALAIVEAREAEGTFLLTPELISRALAECTESLREPERQVEHARAFAELLASERLLGPRRLMWIRTALPDEADELH